MVLMGLPAWGDGVLSGKRATAPPPACRGQHQCHINVTLMSHKHHTNTTLTLHPCHQRWAPHHRTDVVPVPHWCDVSVTPAPRRCHPDVTSVPPHHATNATPAPRRFQARVTPAPRHISTVLAVTPMP